MSNYWQGRPQLDGIEYVYIEDPAVALEAYRRVSSTSPGSMPTRLPEILADPELSAQLLTYPTAGTHLPGHVAQQGAVH